MNKLNCFLSAIFLLSFRILSAQQVTEPIKEVVNTAAGKVSGNLIQGVFVFKGIPYAAQPVGELRFAAPAPHSKWDTVRGYIEDGTTAPFNLPKTVDIEVFPALSNGWVKGEEYLTVNVWKPASITSKLPVMVFIHGGAFVIGSQNGKLFDGSNFARNGVVLVTLNYRLGIEGFLKIEGVPSNLGIRDQIAALQWVKNNIAAFGGDADNITIFGESAGAMSVGILTVSPAARGLFKRAIMMSGSGEAVLSAEQAERVAKAYSKKLRIKNTREAWCRFTPEEILMAQPKVTPNMVNLQTEEYADPTGGLVLFFPVIDNEIIPEIPLKAMERNSNVQDLLIGYNSDEVNYFLVPTKLMKLMKFDLILKKAVKKVHPAPSAVIAVYRSVYPARNGGEILSAIMTAYQFQLPSIRFARAHSMQPAGHTFMYEFAWKSSVAGGRYGAFHGLALPFVFDNLDLVKGEKGMLGTGPVPDSLAKNIQQAFIKFARNGNPGWDAYNIPDSKTMLISETWKIETRPHDKELSIWDGVR